MAHAAKHAAIGIPRGCGEIALHGNRFEHPFESARVAKRRRRDVQGKKATDFKMSSLSAPMRCMASAAAFGGGGYPFAGLLTLQWKRCGIVPGCSKQSWQESSVIFHFATLHLRTCGHCPPLIAEASDGAHVGPQSVSAFLPGPPPATIALTTRAKSITWKSVQGVGQSEGLGAAVGTRLIFF